MRSKSSDNRQVETRNRQIGCLHAPEVTPEVLRMLSVLEGDLSRQDLQNLLDLKDREHFRQAYLQPALREGLVEMTLPDKPRSSKQRYRLTGKGRSVRGGGRS